MTNPESQHSFFSDSVIVGGGESPLRVVSAHIKTKGSVIDSVTEISRDDMDWEGVKDLKQLVVSPAFINSHTHLSMCALRSLGGQSIMSGNVIEDLYFNIETSLSREDVRAFARIGAYESLLSGVAVVWDHYYHGLGLADALVDTGLAGVVAPTLQDLSGPGKDHHEQTLKDTLDIAESAHFLEHGVVAALGPHATDTVSNELWQRISGVAKSKALPIHAHLAQSLEEYQRNMDVHGCSPTQRLHRLGVLEQIPQGVFAHNIYSSQDDLKLLDREKHLLVLCPYSQLQFCFPASAAHWAKNNMSFSLATDCGASNDSMSPQGELRWLAGTRTASTTSSDAYQHFCRDGGLKNAQDTQLFRNAEFSAHDRFADPDFLLSTLWSTPGTWTPKQQAGVIKAGAWAHFSIWDPSHPCLWPNADILRGLAMADAPQALAGMMVNGQWIGQLGNYRQSLLESERFKDALAEANTRFSKLQFK